MDKSWLNMRRGTLPYNNGVLGFISHASQVASFGGQIKCPCIECRNEGWKDAEVVENHLVVEGMWHDYMQGPWVWHGEAFGSPLASPMGSTANQPSPNGDGEFETLLHDLFPGCRNMDEVPCDGDNGNPLEPPNDVQQLYKLLEEASKELYPGCRGLKKMDFVLRMYQHKCLYGVSDIGFTAMLQLIKQILPLGETLPKNFYETKKLVSAFELKYEKIDACPYDCILYRKEYSALVNCPNCGTNRYTTDSDSTIGPRQKRIPQKVLRYFPITPRLQRLYMSRHTAEDMCWHAIGRTDDGHLRHPGDARAWKHLDAKFPTFGGEMRNVRLGLASDGFNPFGTMSISHSTWPVLLTVYNLPPWLCMKQPYVFMSLLIPGPRGPGNDIDVFLEPLIDELKDLWDNGATTYDAFRQANFLMRAAIMWTINDFPAYANLSGWSTKGKNACPNCHYETDATWLTHGKKLCYRGHRRHLPMSHPFRQQHESFNLSTEMRSAPIPLTGSECLQRLSTLTFSFGKPPPLKVGEKRPPPPPHQDTPLRKCSIFFKLPYWEHLLIRHNLDVMHVEKNVFDSVIGTLLGIPGKSKDSINARLDMELMGIKEGLWPVREGNVTRLPMGIFSLKNDEKELICKVLASAILPDGRASNISRNVHVKERTIHGLKSHDCHVIMQELLPVAIRHALPPEMTKILLELSAYFRHLYSKKGSVESFHKLTSVITMILCQLERIMPPAFFDVMVHVTIHLAEEAALAGPVQYRCMWPIERYLHTLIGYVRNKRYPEGSISVGYLADECVAFYAMYLKDAETRISRPKRNADGTRRTVEGGLAIFEGGGQSLGKGEDYNLSNEEWELARSYVLANCPPSEIKQRKYVEDAQKNRPRRVSMMQAEKQALISFPDWYATYVNELQLQGDLTATDDLIALANGPSKWCIRYKRYVSNGFRFKVRNLENLGKTQNWGVFVESEQSSYATANDRNPRDGMVGFYGALVDVYELIYDLERKVVLFKCDWIDSMRRGRGLQYDQYGFTLVNFSRCLPPNQDPFIFASQAMQIYYVQDPIDEDLHVVMKTKPRDLFDMGTSDEYDPCDRQDIEHVFGSRDEVPVRIDI